MPYWEEHGQHLQLIVPYTLDTTDMRFATPQGFNAGNQFFAHLKSPIGAVIVQISPSS